MSINKSALREKFCKGGMAAMLNHVASNHSCQFQYEAGILVAETVDKIMDNFQKSIENVEIKVDTSCTDFCSEVPEVDESGLI